jgi:hypothetical protein
MPWESPTTWHFYKWPPNYWPPEPWQTVGSNGPPPGEVIPWWLEDKSNWPYVAPWEPKVFGAISPFWFKMREDIGAPVNDGPSKPWPPANIWPTVTFPKPAGLTHVNTRPDGVLGATKSVPTIKVHMPPTSWLEVTPHPSAWAQGKYEEAIRVMSRKRPIRIVSEDGSSITLKSIRSANWMQHQADMKHKAKLQREVK